MLHRSILVSLCAALLVTVAKGQSRTAENRRWAPSSILAELGIKRGLLQDLSVPSSQAPGFEVVVGLGNKTRTLLLQAHDVRTRDFQLLVHDQHGLHVAPTPPNTTYRGVVLGRPESIVAASLLKGQLHATIKLDGMLWAVQPVSTIDKTAARTLHITFRSTDNLPDNRRCVALDPPNHFAPAIRAGGPALNAGAGATIYNCELACDADNSYFVRHGSDVIATQNDVVRVINGVGAIFRSDVDIDYRITNVIIRKQVIYTATRDSQAVIQEFRTYWKRNHSKVVRDLCHLFTDRSMYNVIGVGWVGVVCRDLGYAVSRSLSPVNILNRYTLTAHELGHNWGCPHCSNPPTTCDIMCGRTDPCFSDVSKGLIRAHRDSSSCLQKIDPRPNLIAVRKPARGEQMVWSYKAGPRHFWFLTISPTNTYTPALGFKFMDNSLLLLNGQVDQWGLGYSSVTVPSSTTIGLRFYSQLVTVHSIKQSISGTSLIIATTVQ